jgi:hypothetical protein
MQCQKIISDGRRCSTSAVIGGYCLIHATKFGKRCKARTQKNGEQCSQLASIDGYCTTHFKRSRGWTSVRSDFVREPRQMVVQVSR